LDDYFINFNHKTVDILKIDVEGHEMEVLKGGRYFIQKYVNYLIVEVSMMRDQADEKQSIFEIFKFMDQSGFILHNIIDIHLAGDGTSSLLQMDCVFKNINVN
jgi:hypothetical protein